MKHNYDIDICGLVQGVGFRPFIYKIASQLSINGIVRNNNEGVRLNIECTEDQKNLLLERINNEKPQASFIEDFYITENPLKSIYSNFKIVSSNIFLTK